jgi:dTDP-4-amino-4,6-dideoxygalactose transaminase
MHTMTKAFTKEDMGEGAANIASPTEDTATSTEEHAFIPFHRPWIGPQEEAEIIDTLRSGWLTTGAKTRRFEQQFAEYVQARNAIGVNSCTAALHLSLIAYQIGPGCEVITSPITFAATANVIEHVGATPVFVDVQPDTLNMNPNMLKSAITPRTRAIIAVHFAGHPCDMDAIHRIAEQHDLAVIEDAAHAVESEYQDRKIGHLSSTTCFSFYATKNMTTAEGGMVTTDNDELAERLRVLSLHGISVDAWKRYRPGEYKHWDIIAPGFKYNMSDLQACLGIHQLARIEQMRQLRQRWVKMYDEGFGDIPEIVPLQRHDNVKCAYHIYPIMLDTDRLKIDRDEFMGSLQERGIGIGVHFRPVHLHPYYRDKYGFKAGTLPVAEKAGERLVSLPLFPGLIEGQVQRVVEQVRELVIHSR